jgi:hypothetical protein
MHGQQNIKTKRLAKRVCQSQKLCFMSTIRAEKVCQVHNVCFIRAANSLKNIFISNNCVYSDVIVSDSCLQELPICSFHLNLGNKERFYCMSQFSARRRQTFPVPFVNTESNLRRF